MSEMEIFPIFSRETLFLFFTQKNRFLLSILNLSILFSILRINFIDYDQFSECVMWSTAGM